MVRLLVLLLPHLPHLRYNFILFLFLFFESVLLLVYLSIVTSLNSNNKCHVAGDLVSPTRHAIAGPQVRCEGKMRLRTPLVRGSVGLKTRVPRISGTLCSPTH